MRYMPSNLRPLSQGILLALTLAPSLGSAATFTVTNNADAGAGSLRQAVLDANGAAGADTINFNAGLGTITLTTGEIVINEALTIQGPAAGQVISGNNAARIFAVPQADTPLTLENLSLQNGRTTLAGSIGGDCGGGEGGAICTLSALTLTNSTISGNSTTGIQASGGGIFVYGALTTLTNSTISGNSTAGNFSNGGGLFTVYGNSTLTNSTISGNSTAGNYADGGGVATIYGSTTLTNSTISGNSTAGASAYGGGLYLYSANASLTNSTISGNSVAGAGASGGGLSTYGGTVTLTNSTVVNNSAVAVLPAYAAGIDIYGGTLTLTSTIVVGNREAGVLDDCRLTGGATLGASTFNLIESTGNAACGLTHGVNNNQIGVAPALALLADNGCATLAGSPVTAACVQTHLPNAGSPALDAGSNPQALATDQRGAGFPRVVGAAPDVGAVEGLAVAIPTLAPWGLGLLLGLLGWLGTRYTGTPRRR